MINILPETQYKDEIICVHRNCVICQKGTISGNTSDAGVDLIIHRAPRVAICIAVNRWTFKIQKIETGIKR